MIVLRNRQFSNLKEVFKKFISKIRTIGHHFKDGFSRFLVNVSHKDQHKIIEHKEKSFSEVDLGKSMDIAPTKRKETVSLDLKPYWKYIDPKDPEKMHEFSEKVFEAMRGLVNTKEYQLLRSFQKKNLEQLCKVFSESNKTELNWASSDVLWKFYRIYPTFLGLVPQETILKYFADSYAAEKKLYAEVLFMYNSTLALLYDFNYKIWVIQDRTYFPVKEWRVKDGRFCETFKDLIDPEKNSYLKHTLENTPEGPLKKFINDYINWWKAVLERASKL